MENASKALIIAGAILLSILIIALGMTVYNSSSSVTEGMDMTSQEISSFNSTFLAYGGEKKGRQVIELVTKIQSNNSQYADRQISIKFSNTTTEATSTSEPSTVRSNVNMTTTYKVIFGYDNKGLINECSIYVK